MINGNFSRTALGAARLRAAHQVLDGGQVFSDPLAIPILGEPPESYTSDGRSGLRLFLAARSRLAEDWALAALQRGVRQIVLLGAGLDTFAYRLRLAPGLRVFEVDHPATQAEKRRCLATAGIAEPEHVRYTPIDFERESLGVALERSGFEALRPSFVSWLGVVPYLTETAIFATLAWIAALPGGAEVGFDYANPPGSVGDPARRAAMEALEARVASQGERIESYFETEALRARLGELGFSEIEDLGPAALRRRFAPERPASADDRGGRILRARTSARFCGRGQEQSPARDDECRSNIGKACFLVIE